MFSLIFCLLYIPYHTHSRAFVDIFLVSPALTQVHAMIDRYVFWISYGEALELYSCNGLLEYFSRFIPLILSKLLHYNVRFVSDQALKTQYGEKAKVQEKQTAEKW